MIALTPESLYQFTLQGGERPPSPPGTGGISCERGALGWEAFPRPWVRLPAAHRGSLPRHPPLAQVFFLSLLHEGLNVAFWPTSGLDLAAGCAGGAGRGGETVIFVSAVNTFCSPRASWRHFMVRCAVCGRAHVWSLALIMVWLLLT